MRNLLRTLVIAACGLAVCFPGQAQTPPATILEIDLENVVLYYDDTSDPSRFAVSPGVVSLAANFNWVFKWSIMIGDIVAVNGKPAKGLYVVRSIPPRYTNVYAPGRAISDVAGNCVQDDALSILSPDGTPVGTILAFGLGGVAPPPGAPSTATVHDLAVTGGTGVFLGMRGYLGVVRSAAIRSTSMVEDPANRRINGGGTRRLVLHLIPMTWPEVMSLPTGPAVFHAGDFSPVTAEKPAQAGELLVMRAANLGPTQPGLDPGKPFPVWAAGKEYLVNSPLQVTVGGLAAEVRNAIGWPEMTNVYRVDFRVPDGVKPGLTSLRLTVAWIDGPEVQIPVR